jgi:hypothetical protein
MRLRNAIVWSLILSAIASAAFLVLTPPVDDFNTANPYWNGMSYIASYVGAQQMPATGYDGMDPKAGSLAVVVVGPDMPFDNSYAYPAMSFAGAGGMLVVMDDFGTGNQLLASIFGGTGFGASLSGAWLADPLYMHKSQYYPKVEYAQGEVVMDYGTAIVGLSGDYTVLAWSSAFSYLDENMNGRHDAGEPEGPFPVAVEFDSGNGGRLVIVADSSAGINAVSGLEGNAAFMASLLEGRTVYIDSSHRSPSPFSIAKSAAVWGASLLYVPEVRYLAAIAGAFAIASVDWDRRAFKLRLGGGDGRRRGRGSGSGDDMPDIYAEELERAAEEHPDWDYRTLERLAEERRRAGAAKGAE